MQKASKLFTNIENMNISEERNMYISHERVNAYLSMKTNRLFTTVGNIILSYHCICRISWNFHRCAV